MLKAKPRWEYQKLPNLPLAGSAVYVNRDRFYRIPLLESGNEYRD